MPRKKTTYLIIGLAVVLLAGLSIFAYKYNNSFELSDGTKQRFSIDYYIRKQDDNCIYDISKKDSLELAKVYKTLYGINGKIEWIIKRTSFSGGLRIKLVIYYLKDKIKYKYNCASKIIVDDSLGKMRISMSDTARLPIDSFAGICDDQYFLLSPFDDKKTGNYDLGFLYYPESKLLHISITIDSIGRPIKNLKTKCDSYVIKEYVDLIQKETF